MADIGTKLSVTGISQYKSAMQEAANSVKTLDKELKRNEAQYKATGDKEQYMAQKSELLDKKLTAQKAAIKQAESALKELERQGVDPTSDAYKRMENQLISAETAMYKTQAQINEMSNSEKTAAGNADQLTTSLNGISRKVSLEQVIGGIDKITGGLETAAKKAIELGKALFDEILDRAAAADDTATMAQMYGIDLQTFKRMQALVEGGMDTSVESILSAQDRLKRGVGRDSKEVIENLKQLGIVTEQFGGKSEEAMEVWATKDPDQLFWMAGKRLMEMGDAFDKEAAATALFGKSWKTLVPLFSTFDSFEDYQKALSETTVSSEESTENLAALNDAVSKLQNNFTQLEDEVLGGLAPGLTAAADSLSNLLAKVMDYLQTPEGQKMLDDLSTAVTGLFEDLGSIDPDAVVAGFTAVFDKIVGGVQWLVENKDAVGNALLDIVKTWAGLKLTGGLLQLARLIDGIKGLRLFGGGAKAVGDAGGGGVFSKAWNGGKAALGGAKDAILAGGSASIMAFLAAQGALGYAGAKMIDANLNDPELIQIYGTGNNDSMISTMSDAAVRAAEEYWQVYQDTGSEKAMEAREKLEDVLLGEGFTKSGQGVSLIEQIFDNMLNGSDPDGLGALLSGRGNFENGVPIPVVPEAPEDAADVIAAQVGTVTLPVRLHFNPGWGGGLTNGTEAFMHANGLWSVPWDGYPAILHKNERIVPAREVSSRSFSSNLYVESMVMNGGADS